MSAASVSASFNDSKFTTLKDGRVNFCLMNTVCAAGTGSFIEEQAQKLDCPLTEYAGRALNSPSPLASNRCTVFMERDINHLLFDGYSPNEILATVLHSIAENYLGKVAAEKHIGSVICFQGATAKNPALVAAFEQRLGKPIHVSRFCHLTGAIGAARVLADAGHRATRFRGLDLWRRTIPTQVEICGGSIATTPSMRRPCSVRPARRRPRMPAGCSRLWSITSTGRCTRSCSSTGCCSRSGWPASGLATSWGLINMRANSRLPPSSGSRSATGRKPPAAVVHRRRLPGGADHRRADGGRQPAGEEVPPAPGAYSE